MLPPCSPEDLDNPKAVSKCQNCRKRRATCPWGDTIPRTMNLVKLNFAPAMAESPVVDVDIIEITSDDDDSDSVGKTSVIVIESDGDGDDEHKSNNNDNSDDDGNNTGDSDDKNASEKNSDNDNDGDDQIMADGEATPILRDPEPFSMGKEQLERILRATEAAFSRECLEMDREFKRFVETLLE